MWKTISSDSFLILYHVNPVCANLSVLSSGAQGVSAPQAGQDLPAEASHAARGQAVGKVKPASCCEVILLKEILDRSCKGVAHCSLD